MQLFSCSSLGIFVASATCSEGSNPFNYKDGYIKSLAYMRFTYVLFGTVEDDWLNRELLKGVQVWSFFLESIEILPDEQQIKLLTI